MERSEYSSIYYLIFIIIERAPNK